MVGPSSFPFDANPKWINARFPSRKLPLPFDDKVGRSGGTITDTKLCILTGAAGEVGRATARRFAEHGWSMVLCNRTTEIVALAKDLAAEFGRTCLGIQMDLASDHEIDRVVAEARETGIPLRFLGLVAAINHQAVSIENIGMSLWDRYENWASRAALDEHMETAHLQELIARQRELLAIDPDIRLLTMISPP